MGLFHFKNQLWLIATDYYSRYPELVRLEKLTSAAIINHCKSIIPHHGVPKKVVFENGPQFSSTEFSLFAQDYGFKHITSSPDCPQGNGLAEAAVKIIKTSMTETKDPYLTLLAYRSTSLKNEYSPDELLMGRRLRSRLPLCSTKLTHQLPDQDSLRNFEERYRQRQRKDFDRRHGVRYLSELLHRDAVWVTDLKSKGTVQAPTDEPRSYWVNINTGAVTLPTGIPEVAAA
nr:uncharacterized protein LOC119187867 [Rhipicephalus microplus]